MTPFVTWAGNEPAAIGRLWKLGDWEGVWWGCGRLPTPGPARSLPAALGVLGEPLWCGTSSAGRGQGWQRPFGPAGFSWILLTCQGSPTPCPPLQGAKGAGGFWDTGQSCPLAGPWHAVLREKRENKPETRALRDPRRTSLLWAPVLTFFPGRRVVQAGACCPSPSQPPRGELPWPCPSTHPSFPSPAVGLLRQGVPWPRGLKLSVGGSVGNASQGCQHPVLCWPSAEPGSARAGRPQDLLWVVQALGDSSRGGHE